MVILNQIVEKRKQQLLKEQSAIGFEEMKALCNAGFKNLYLTL